MIKKIKLSNVATFSNSIEVNELKKINFFYGSNGTGKTTISKVLANPENFRDCNFEWENNRKTKTIVFNEEFIRNYFYEKDVLNGIYTIGEGASEIENNINQKKDELDKVSSELQKLNSTKHDREQEKSKNYDKLKESCWEKGYLSLQDDFDLFFTGYKKDKEKFANKILGEKTNDAILLSKDELKRKYDLIYARDVSKIDEILLIPTEQIQKIETKQEILKTAIIGKKDVDISAMIEKLHNHDWVKQGKEYYDKNYDEERKSYICPFCQQTTSENFRKQLEEYFDETYQNNINDLNYFIEEYQRVSQEILNLLEQVLKIDNQYINEEKNKIEDKKKIIEGLINENIQLLREKETNPSKKIELKSILTELNNINSIFNEVNQKIKEHNRLIDNKQSEKPKLEKKIWKYITDLLSKEIQSYENINIGIEKALGNIDKQIKNNKLKEEEIKKQISELEKQIKSVKPTVDNINKILENFGFRGFKLKPADDEKHYHIIRNDGSDAKKTLSEGERNFLVFLYFYHLIYGVDNPEENINQDKILVIDDPVSSLDSDVLFIVSTLIRGIIDKVRKNQDTVKQIFIFTHNAYFFKEVTFISSRESCYNKRHDTLYFIVRKKDNISSIEKYDTCPIKTSYQLLWDDIKKSEVDCISLQNSMRRIIEFYFKFLANLNENNLINQFNGIEKNIFKSLIAWINAGSHEIIDDFNVTISNEQIEIFKNVFKNIFEYTGHIEHYNMMMGVNKENISPPPSAP
ncbi:MAG: AAA family ATPase [Spirochaetota bacterium]